MLKKTSLTKSRKKNNTKSKTTHLSDKKNTSQTDQPVNLSENNGHTKIPDKTFGTSSHLWMNTVYMVMCVQ